jgi:hypothetical protein
MFPYHMFKTITPQSLAWVEVDFRSAKNIKSMFFSARENSGGYDNNS